MVKSVKEQFKTADFFEKPLNKSKGILDDFPVRKNIATREGTIEKTPTANNDIVNKAYADSLVNHNILSSNHTDSVVNSVSIGSLIYGNTTPKWDELGIGTDNYYLKVNSTIPAWEELSIIDDLSPQLGGTLDNNNFNFEFDNNFLFSVNNQTIELVASQNDYALIDGYIFRFDNSSGGSINITGIIPQANSPIINITNVGANNIVFKHLSASSASANQFFLTDARDITLTPNQNLILMYDNVTRLWRSYPNNDNYGDNLGDHTATQLL